MTAPQDAALEADAQRFRDRAKMQGYRIEEFREMHDLRLAVLANAGMWPPRLRALEEVHPRTTEEKR